MIRAFTFVNPEVSLLKEKLDSVVQQSLSPQDHLLSIHNVLAEAMSMQAFVNFIADQSKADNTWKLWSNFVFCDCFCYISLFLAIRTSNWQLRMSSLKQIAPLFSAYDRPCYQRLIPNHIADVESYPVEIKKCFEAGGFTVKLRNGIGHAVALDEAHEVCINRDMKMAVTRPTTAYLQKTMFFFSYRIKAHKQFISQLFPTNNETNEVKTIFDYSTTTKHWEENVMKMRSVVQKHNMLIVRPLTATEVW